MNRVLGALLVVLATLLASPASAADRDEIGLSNDGKHYATELPKPLFDPAFRWVPGDDERASFYVRNQARTPGKMTITLTNPRPTSALASSLLVDARIGKGRWQSLSLVNGGKLKSKKTLAAKHRVRVDVRVRFPGPALNPTQELLLPLRVNVTLTQSGPAVAPAQTDLNLPATGTTIPSYLLLLAAALFVFGLGLLRSSRRPVPQERPIRHEQD